VFRKREFSNSTTIDNPKRGSPRYRLANYFSRNENRDRLKPVAGQQRSVASRHTFLLSNNSLFRAIKQQDRDPREDRFRRRTDAGDNGIRCAHKSSRCNGPRHRDESFPLAPRKWDGEGDLIRGTEGASNNAALVPRAGTPA